jgi:mono/diheme cytochrome c family protein
MTRGFTTIVVTVLLCAGWMPAGPARSQPPQSSRGHFAGRVAPVFVKYCIQCHGGARPKADLALDKWIVDENTALKHPDVWEKVAQNLRSGDMPPQGKPRPSKADIQTVTSWIDQATAQIDCTKKRDPGRVTIRRLNRAEYRNTIRDLLGVDYKPTEDFPMDEVGYGFDNIGDVLTMSPLLMERYLEAADKIVTAAFKDRKLRDRIVIRPKGKENRFKSVRKTLETLARRAYRRPVTREEVDRLGQFIRVAFQNGQDFDQGLQLAIKAMLVSPHFLFRIEQDRNNDAGAIYPISEYELATRLSYFLWSSMPDDELFTLAAKSNLRQGDNLEKQVRRMLREPKARALTENFAGQWLQLRNLKEASPDPKQFPTFTPELRQAMQRETELFFDAIVREDRSILDFLDADFTFVNEPLARHYGIAGIKGKEFQRVKLDGRQRGGILTQAAILTVTSNPTRTSLVKRGKWILENILNAPPPPPPPEAGELPEDGKELRGSLRQRMETHRSKPLCAACHQRMDPLGFALENYDAVGAWRTHDGKFPIDARGTLPNGQSFNGSKELRQVLKSRAGEFRKCLVDKMLTYALGRGLESYDRCAVQDICRAVESHQDRFSSLVVAIVKSDPFQFRKGRGSAKNSK